MAKTKQNGQRAKQWWTKYNTEIKTLNNMDPIKTGVNTCDPEGSTVLAPLVTPVVLLSNDTNIILYRNPVGHQYK